MAFSVAGQTVVVVGGARSGVAVAELLHSRGAHVTVADHRLEPFEGAAHLQAAGIAVELGPHREALLHDADLIVLSPGVPPHQPMLDAARQRGIPVIGEIELASRCIAGRVVAITGTKGKSTTTTLVARMLQQGGFDAPAGGNLGTPLSSQVSRSTPDTIHVVEVSSFQLETTETFHPWISVLVNLSPDHLDRHPSFEAYADAKARMFMNQTADDWAVVNWDDAPSQHLARHARARRVDFGFGVDLVDGVTVLDDDVVERRAGVVRRLFPVSGVRLPGQHLLADVLAAAAVAAIVGVAPEAMQRAVETFDGLEHALQRVADVDGVRFINDSKATNIVSARRSIESVGPGVVVILGGRYKGGEFGDLADVLRASAKGVVAIGEASHLVEAALANVVPVVRADSMRAAVSQAFAMAAPAGVVLLAPACSSFDMFTDYAARGLAFVEAAREIETAQARSAAMRP